MATTAVIDRPSESLTQAARTEVWKQVWTHVPSDEKDDAALARELRSPRWKALVSYVNRHLGTLVGQTTIELGSGRGDLSVLLAKHGARVTLADYSEKALELARKRFHRLGLHAEFLHHDMLSGNDAVKHRFAISLSSGVIEHFQDTERAASVKAHHDVLRPGGLTMISVPHSHCFPYRLWKSYLELRGWWPYGVEIPYSKREMLSLATRAGFHDPTVTCTNFWQAVGDQWGRNILGAGPDWIEKPSRLDHRFGFNLLLFGQRNRDNNPSESCERIRQ